MYIAPTYEQRLGMACNYAETRMKELVKMKGLGWYVAMSKALDDAASNSLFRGIDREVLGRLVAKRHQERMEKNAEFN